MWLVAAELIVSEFWAYVMGLIFLLWVIGLFTTLPSPLEVSTVLPGWPGVILGATCLIQFALSLVIDSRYESRQLGQFYYWIIWYPMAYWVIHAAASVVAVPRAMLKRRGTRAIWVSPDRGIRPESGD
jgi:biofilm PGA synthesis N-glycosyltransferase PgaC